MNRRYRRAPRPALTRAPAYRAFIPVLLLVLVIVMLAIVMLAGGVLLGLLPYPGR